MSASTLEKVRNGFSPVFWVANTLELFERLAFYGSKAVLSFYLVHAIGLELADAGWMVGIFSGLVFSLPIVGGVFVDRFGFRKTLIVCFSIFAAGYFLIALAGMPQGAALAAMMGKGPYVMSALVLTALGGSLIKPCIVGTVERTSKPDYRSLGFSIYYSLVNLGGAIGPMLGSEVRARLGIEYVFVMSAIFSALMILGTLLFFREPELASGELPARRSFARLFADMMLIFANARFVSFLVLFSGFWIMFWQVFYSLPFYVDEVLKFPRFELLETVDAWSIILLSVPLTALAKRLRPMSAMVLGFLIASASWLIVASAQTITATVIGLFSLCGWRSHSGPPLLRLCGISRAQRPGGHLYGLCISTGSHWVGGCRPPVGVAGPNLSTGLATPRADVDGGCRNRLCERRATLCT